MPETTVQRAIRARLTRPPPVSKRALAAEIGVKADRLIAWERGSRPRDYQLVKMAPHLDVSVDELRGERPGPDEGLPTEVVATLRRLLATSDIVPAMNEIHDRAPDLVKALEDVRRLAKEFEL